MASDRTLVTELATALGALPYSDLASALDARSPTVRIDQDTWDQLAELYAGGQHQDDFAMAYRNGRAFATADDGLRGRWPQLIEWTGGRRPPGDEVAPIDLRIDHVYLISCKYLSANISNPSPARLFDGLLVTSGAWDRGDWYASVAPAEYQTLYEACCQATGLCLPARATELTNEQRRWLRTALPGRSYPADAQDAYRNLCRVVSDRSAQRWRARLAVTNPELMLWRLLRIGNAPYFLLGAHGPASLRRRIDTAWDWRQHYQFKSLDVRGGAAGQPRVDWTATYTDKSTGTMGTVAGHVEIRWSHGRFSQPPEAKIYLDTPVNKLPGYQPLEIVPIGLGPDPGPLLEVLG